MSHALRQCMGISMMLLVLATPLCAQDQRESTHYLYHSVFIYNFCKYIQWPDDNRLHVIGVLGDSPILQGLYQMARAKSTPNQRFVVRRYEKIEDIDENCHILFIPGHTSLSALQKRQLLQKLQSKPVLILTEREEQILEFSGINFFVHNGRLLFQINPKHIEMRGLKISYQLLRLGVIVQ